MIATLLFLGASVAPTDVATLALASPGSPLLATAQADAIAEGMKKLLARDADGAMGAFESAHKASGGSLETELWVLRGRFAKGDLAAFDRVTAIEAEGAEGAAINYVIGAGRYAMGKADEAKGGGKAGQYFDEAAAYLSDAMSTAPDSFADGWRMLAEASRWIGRAEAAAGAIDRALEQERSVETLTLASKIRVARGAELVGKAETKAAGKRIIEQGVKDAAAAAEGLGEDKGKAGALGDIHLQRALGLLFLERKDDAASAYVDALSWDPTQADYGQIMTSLRGDDGDARFIGTLKKGAGAFERRWGAEQNSDATLRWWLGYAQHFAGEYNESLASFELCLKKFPAFTNCHWFIGLNHYRTGVDNVPKAAEAWKAYAKADMRGFASTLAQDTTGAVGGAIGALYANGRGGERMEMAAELAELVTKAKPADATSWNNLGLMARDTGAWVNQAKPEQSRMTAAEYWEQAWDAYSKALELESRPEYYNDGAVLLHYYLERDYERAFEMYDSAEELAKEWLANRELTEGERQIVEIALRDAGDNRAKLKAKIENEKKGS